MTLTTMHGIKQFLIIFFIFSVFVVQAQHNLISITFDDDIYDHDSLDGCIIEAMYSAPLKCGYDPYIGVCEEWSATETKSNHILWHGRFGLFCN